MSADGRTAGTVAHTERKRMSWLRPDDLGGWSPYEEGVMHKVTVHTLTFYRPGLVFGESESRESTMPMDTAKVEWPDNAYAFSIGERIDVHDEGEVFTGKHRQVGPLYYHPDSVVQTAQDIEAGRGPARNGQNDILLSNMRCNGWDRVIWSRWGNWPQPYDPDKHQILKEG